MTTKKNIGLIASGAFAAAAVSGLVAGVAYAAPGGHGVNRTGHSPLTMDAGTKAHEAGHEGAGQASCKGKNDCKGKGGCASSDNGCQGKNSCKGKGGCDSSHGEGDEGSEEGEGH